MRTWMLPWLLPVGLLGTVMFVVVAGRYVALITIALAVVLLVPILWRGQARAPGGDDDTSYWRIKRL